MKDKKKNGIERKIIPYVWIYAFLVSIVLLIVSKGSFILPLSFLLGTFTSLLCFTLTIKCVDRLIYDEKLNARAEYVKTNVLKMMVYAVVLACAGYSFFKHGDKTFYLNFYATAAGFFSVKIMIYFNEFVISKIFPSKNEEGIDNIQNNNAGIIEEDINTNEENNLEVEEPTKTVKEDGNNESDN